MKTIKLLEFKNPSDHVINYPPDQHLYTHATDLDAALKRFKVLNFSRSPAGYLIKAMRPR